MIDGSENRNRQLAFELKNSHVCEKRSMNHNYIWRFNVLQICLSLPPFVFGVLFTPSCDGLRGVSKFRDTALIIG